MCFVWSANSFVLYHSGKINEKIIITEITQTLFNAKLITKISDNICVRAFFKWLAYGMDTDLLKIIIII